MDATPASLQPAFLTILSPFLPPRLMSSQVSHLFASFRLPNGPLKRIARSLPRRASKRGGRGPRGFLALGGKELRRLELGRVVGGVVNKEL